MATPTTAAPPRTPRMFDTGLRFAGAGPRGVPLVNNLRFLATMAQYAMTALAPFRDQPVVPITSHNGSIVVALGEAAARQVYTDNATFHRAGEGVFNLPPGQPWSGMFDAVITANGEEHRRRRRLLMPIVHRTALDHYRDVFVETFQASRFGTGRAGDQFDLVDELMRISRVNMLRCLLGLPDAPEHHHLAAAILHLTEQINKPQVVLAQWNQPFTPYGRWVREVAAVYYRLAELIAARRAEEPRPDALSILCHTTDEDGGRFSTEEIAGELHGLFAAGFETTAMTMTWAMVPLLGRVAGAPAREPLDLTDPAVIDAVVKESQRLLPAVPMSLPRRVTADVSIAGSPPVPRGAMLFSSAILEHHSADTYPEPDGYRPERWLSGGGCDPGPYQFFPFGVGARRCLGTAFAELQARTTLSLIYAADVQPRLRTTKINYRMKSGVTAAPRAPIMVELGSGPAPAPPTVTGSVTDYWTS